MSTTYETFKSGRQGRAQTIERRSIRAAKYAPTALYTWA